MWTVLFFVVAVAGICLYFILSERNKKRVKTDVQPKTVPVNSVVAPTPAAVSDGGDDGGDLMDTVIAAAVMTEVVADMTDPGPDVIVPTDDNTDFSGSAERSSVDHSQDFNESQQIAESYHSGSSSSDSSSFNSDSSSYDSGSSSSSGSDW